jgi:hypothetical protein
MYEDPVEDTVSVNSLESLRKEWKFEVNALKICLRTTQIRSDFIANSVEILNKALTIVLDRWIQEATTVAYIVNKLTIIDIIYGLLHFSLEVKKSSMFFVKVYKQNRMSASWKN